MKNYFFDISESVFIFLAGEPTTGYGQTDFVTTVPATTNATIPIVMPFNIVTLQPILTSSSTQTSRYSSILLPNSGMS